jgi:hypothetical protein
MDDLTGIQKQNIRKIVADAGETGIIHPESRILNEDSPMLEKIAELLLMDKDLRLQMNIISPEGIQNDPLEPEKLSQQLEFYFRNKVLNENSFQCNPGNFKHSANHAAQTENKSGEINVEFIFMRNSIPLHD